MVALYEGEAPLCFYTKCCGIKLKLPLPNTMLRSKLQRKFMRRHSIVLRAKTSEAQKLPKDLESKIEAFYKEVQDQREDGKYSNLEIWTKRHSTLT